jgi:hypothetical protein
MGTMCPVSTRGQLAPRDRFELPTNGLTVRRSTTELPGIIREARIVRNRGREVKNLHPNQTIPTMRWGT